MYTGHLKGPCTEYLEMCAPNRGNVWCTRYTNFHIGAKPCAQNPRPMWKYSDASTSPLGPSGHFTAWLLLVHYKYPVYRVACACTGHLKGTC